MHQEQLGYEVITPFELDSDNSIVMVSRGWATAPSFEQLVARIAGIEGEKQVTGQLFIPSQALADKTNNVKEVRWPLLIRYLNTLELKPYFGKPLFPYVVRLDADQDGVLVRHWPTVIVDTSRNFSYALQWFALAIAVIVVTLVLSSNVLDFMKQGPPAQDRRKP